MRSRLKSDEVLQACAATLLPLVRYCLLEGVNYPRFVKALKPIFAEAAKLELQRRATKINDSSVSLMSGLHRKDVRELSKEEARPRAYPASVASLVFTKWVSDPRYVFKNGKPRMLDKNGPAPSFESLALSITQDVHPGSILKAMQAQGMVRCERKGKAVRVTLLRDSFIPRDDLSEMLQLFTANLQDHIAAAASNMRGAGPPFLEQAVFASGLSKASVDKLAKFSRRNWENFSLELIKRANKLYQQDKGTAATHRFRLGSYCFEEPIAMAQRQTSRSKSERAK